MLSVRVGLTVNAATTVYTQSIDAKKKLARFVRSPISCYYGWETSVSCGSAEMGIVQMNNSIETSNIEA